MGDFSKINNTLCLYSTLIDFRLTLKYKNTCEKLHDFYRKSRKIYRIRSTLPKKIRAEPFVKIAAVRYDLVQINFIINEKVRIRNVLVILTDYPFSFLQSRESEFYAVSEPYRTVSFIRTISFPKLEMSVFVGKLTFLMKILFRHQVLESNV